MATLDGDECIIGFISITIAKAICISIYPILTTLSTWNCIHINGFQWNIITLINFEDYSEFSYCSVPLPFLCWKMTMLNFHLVF